MATGARTWTRADLERLPNDGNRYEVLDGQLLVTPQASFGHQLVATRLVTALAPWCARHEIGYVVGPGAVIIGESELQPDLQVVPFGEYAYGTPWSDLPRPLLVAEVRSDSTHLRDIGIKRAAYARLGIPEYWFVDPVQREVLVWRAGADAATVVTDVIRWQPRADRPSLDISLAVLYS